MHCVEMAACPMPHSGCVLGDISCHQDFNMLSEKANGNYKLGEHMTPTSELLDLL